MVYTQTKKTVIVSPDVDLEKTYIDDVLTANPDRTKFLFSPGSYYITRSLTIGRPDVSFIGHRNNEVHIFQDSEDDGLDVEADGFVLRNISIHVTQDNKVALIFAGCSDTKVEDCYIYGNSTSFCVYYAGPEVAAGAETLQAYADNNLDSGNVFRKNVVYSDFSGDSVSYSLQKNGTFKDNIIRGGKLAIYMCRTTEITHNILYDSSSQGFFVSLPSHDLKITHNKIYECGAAGIRLSNQGEHGEFESTSYNIDISNNYIYDTKTNSMELDDCIDVKIERNRFLSTDITSLYICKSSNVEVLNNQITYFREGVILFDCNDIEIMSNEFYSVYPYDALRIGNIINSNDNNFTRNVIKGNITRDLFREINSSDNLIDNNDFDRYYTRQEELTILK